ncbi:MAG TPA: hypothetical protein VHV27_09740 [Phenylobacterium sp.]|jgi:hypothetical protein|nr:hypothetical protein [Phenylobacterium sp.]
MSVDRTVRDLAALYRNGSTSRVLNLCAVQGKDAADPEYAAKPFFTSKVLNSSIILKHRVRRDELYMLETPQTIATKIIIPFQHSDLGLGAQSMLVGQKGWREIVRDLCRDSRDYPRDLKVLTLLDQLPSVDPFLLREHLRRNNVEVARCYFAISPGDYERMQAFVSEQIGKLIELAYQRQGHSETEAAKLVKILLSTQVDERLEPLRLTLNLEGEAYKDGVFSWKGFLYYKWMLSDLWPKLIAVMDELHRVDIGGVREPEVARFVESATQRLGVTISRYRRDITQTLTVYDRAYHELTANGRPGAFRDFLVQAPEMFSALGERIGGVSHIASFWRYRFPPNGPLSASWEDMMDILQDFEASLGLEIDLAA